MNTKPDTIEDNMKTQKGFKTVRGRLTFWLLTVAIIPLAIFSAIMSWQRAGAIKEREFSKLVAIRDLKVDEVNRWIDERLGDIRTISEDPEIRMLEKVLKETHRDSALEKIVKNARNLLKRYVQNYADYAEIFILDPRSGHIEISTNLESQGEDKSDYPLFKVPIKTGNVFIQNIYYSKMLKGPTMAFSIPIRGLSDTHELTGILVTRINLKRSLYALLLNRTGMGETGETLIVNEDVTAVNELRWYDDAPLALKIPAEPAILSAEGKTGIIEARDYRGVPVLAAYTYIPRTKWGFVAKQDLSEVYAPIRIMFRDMAILFALAGAVVYGLAVLLARNMARPMRQMADVSRKIEAGDLSARNRVTGRDEVAFLARAINRMTESLESQSELRQINDEITQTLVDARDLPEFRTGILKKLVAVTQSQMGAYFVLNRESRIFEPFMSLGLNHEALKPFDVTTLEGQLGTVVETQKITRITDIPKDSVFLFRTFTGTIAPREIISIPIVIDGVVSGIVALASIKPYPQEILEIMEQPWAGSFATALSNMQANAETARLANKLTEANQNLQAQAEELQSQSEELRQTSEELQEQNIELEAQGRQVEEANRLKSEFLSNMSHELRTPLNSVMALSRVLMMQTREKLSEEEWHYLEIIERNGKNLLSLINDILDLSKIEAGKMDVTPRDFSVTAAIETLMERLEPVAGEKGIGIHQEVPKDLPHIESDEIRVHQILQNVMGNAVKFTEQGQVKISARFDAASVHIEIADTGIGISKDELPHIFDEFRQVDGTTARTYEGTGLGLAIAYKGARMLGGDLTVKSTPGEGSTFTLTLPIRWQGLRLTEVQPVMKPDTAAETSQRTILVVDDEPRALTLISNYLSEEGYRVLTATSGKEAVRIARKHHPFAITLDIIMPEMDGWEVLQELKKHSETKGIPVIIISVSDDRETGVALGAVGFINKPVEREHLISEIHRIDGIAPRTILLAEDNPMERREMAQMISEAGMQTVIAENGRACMERLRESRPDVLVLDLIMPEMDGFQVLEQIQDDPLTRPLPVIVVTAKDLTEKERKRLSGNVSTVLAKSDTTSNALLRELRKLLTRIERKARRKNSRFPGRILLVEDNEAAVIQVKAVLEGAGHTVDVVRDGQAALDYLLRFIPDGIILDLMMPGVDGFEVLEKIRDRDATAHIPVLILTAKDLTPKDLSRLNSNNIQQLIHKGDVDRQRLLSKITKMLAHWVEDRETKKKVEQETARTEQGMPKVTPETENKQMSSAILIVEDNPDNLTTVSAILRQTYSLLTAADGEAGLRMALQERPSLILLDMSLPKMDGFEVLRALKQNTEMMHIPVIAMTAHAMKGDRERMMDAGCDDYISKPLDPNEVLNKISQWLKGEKHAEDSGHR